MSKKENIYSKNLNYIRTNIYLSPSISYINNDMGFHSIKPIRESLSIHFYYPKNHKTNYPKNQIS